MIPGARRSANRCNDDAVTELPPDPDLDDLPEELIQRQGPFTVSARDPDTGEVFRADITKDDLAAAFADARRYEDDDAP